MEKSEKHSKKKKRGDFKGELFGEPSKKKRKIKSSTGIGTASVDSERHQSSECNEKFTIIRSGKKNKSILFTGERRNDSPVQSDLSQNNVDSVEDSVSSVEESNHIQIQRESQNKGKISGSQQSQVQIVEYVDNSQDPNGKRKKKSSYIIAFTGFIPETEYDFKLRHKLAKYVERMKGKVLWGDTFDAEITHIVAPPNCRTMKTLIASLTQRWVLSPNWILDSLKQNKFIDEKPYGNRQSTNVFNNKLVFISTDFATTNLNYNLENFKTLIEVLGKGTITNKAFGADIILVPSLIKHNYHNSGAECLTWKQFFNKIQPING